MTTCIRPNQKNILRFLELRGPATVNEIRFSLDSAHGCVWPPSRILSVLEALWAKGLVRRKSDVWLADKWTGRKGAGRKRTARVYSFNNGGEYIYVKAYSKKQIATHFATNLYQMRGFCDPVGLNWKGKIDVDAT